MRRWSLIRVVAAAVSITALPLALPVVSADPASSVPAASSLRAVRWAPSLFEWTEVDQDDVDQLFPDEVVNDRAPANGCGSQGEEGTDVPDEWFGVSFTESCNWHDRCYGTKGMTQKYCDQGMLARTVVACDGAFRCLDVAAAYYLGVHTFGGDPYREGQLAAEERDECDDARAHGDPHLETFDGAEISFQAAGVFTMVADRDGTLVQARAYPVSEMFSVLTGVAVRLGDQIVSVETDPDTKTATVLIDDVEIGDWLVAGNGTLVIRTEQPGTAGQVTIWRQGEFQVDILLFGPSLDVTVRLFDGARAPFSGMLGDNDGDPADDVVGADGQTFPIAPTFGEHLPDSAFVEALRVPEDRSWFSPSAGFDYHAADISKHPVRAQSTVPLDEQMLAITRELCEEAGVPADLLNACTFDVLYGGSEAYAQRSSVSAAHSRQIHEPHHPADDPDPTTDDAIAVDSNPDLVWAALDGDVEAVRALLADGADPNSYGETLAYTALAAAVTSRSIEVVQLLLDAGADPNLTPDLGGQLAYHPLLVAAASGSIEMARLLVDAGADPNGGVERGDDSSTTPLDTAATGGDLAMVEFLLDAGAATDRGLISTIDPNLAAVIFTPEVVAALGL